ncbi:unnamed protein product [Acanthoscelides obtectus]|uniref:Uncharacterized protein n=1 Tax=Acanthoscelides obtectus TaxID=200917 RepID=A0A9P0PKM9_ACAOB|nr:unnamed protein product [Acanthoscelides obtectus]CAK1637609.1 hypothetical protein AOBTE_LOCUS10084 [Acanthoscelides obtectus]
MLTSGLKSVHKKYSLSATKYRRRGKSSH